MCFISRRYYAINPKIYSFSMSQILEGNLRSSPLRQLTTSLYLAGSVQLSSIHQITHIPVTLRPSTSLHGGELREKLGLLTRWLLTYYARVSRDREWLCEVLASAAKDEVSRGIEPRLHEMRRVLEIQASSERLLALVRADFMLECGRLRLVEVNTVSAAFSCCTKAVEDAHGVFSQADPGAEFATAIASVAGTGVALFVVLEHEHLVCECLLEKQVRERGARVATLTLEGCAQKLSLVNGELILNGVAAVEVVYFRAGISPECWGWNEKDLYFDRRWEARRMIESSRCVKIPDAGWWAAGTKLVQAELWKKETLERFFPEQAELLEECLVPCYSVVEKAEEALEEPESWILKKEPLGVWAGDEMVSKIREICEKAKFTTDKGRDYLLMRKINAEVSEVDVEFVRDGKITAKCKGVSEYGCYGIVNHAEPKSVGILVRTKAATEVDGGVCKGVAVLDSIGGG